MASKTFRWIGDHLILMIGLLVLLYMFLPIFVVVLMSFNDPPGRIGYRWGTFTFDNWTNLCKPYQLCSSLRTSIWIGLSATLLATILGTLMAFALVRHRFYGRSVSSLLIFLPMATPEIVMGSSLLTLFVNMNMVSFLGPRAIFIAHVMFCLSFVVTTVKARIAGMDPRLEQAAMDLYATEWTTFWRITFPLVFPGILSAALLSFSLSFDDFIITNLNAGQTVTFPMFVWGSAQRGVPMQVNVVGTIMFMIALALVLGSMLRGRPKKDRSAKQLARLATAQG